MSMNETAFPAKKTKSHVFTRLAKWTSRVAGRPSAFLLACLVIVVWAVTGPIYHYSNTWQLVINTGTSVATFLMVFLIQNTQYRDSEALQVKLDEVIRSIRGAHNKMMNLEELDDPELEELHNQYLRLAEKARSRQKKGKEQTDSPETSGENNSG